jgi:hypothetical protein
MEAATSSTEGRYLTISEAKGLALYSRSGGTADLAFRIYN